MNLLTLKTVCARFVGKVFNPAPEGQDDLTMQGVDFFLVAANSVRKSAELRHNFEFSRVTALIDINGTKGASLDKATVTSYDPMTNVTGIREVVVALRQRPDGTRIPIDFARVDIPMERDRWETELSDNMYPYLRYPSDALIHARTSCPSLIQRGRFIFIYPHYANSVPFRMQFQLEGYGWVADYVDLGQLTDSPQDFFLAHGYNWMKWAIIQELNYLFGQFVPRLEGTLAPPDKLVDNEWQKFVTWDSYQVDANTTRPR